MTHELRVHDFLSDSTPCHQKNLSLSTQINFKGEKEKQQQEKKKKIELTISTDIVTRVSKLPTRSSPL